MADNKPGLFGRLTRLFSTDVIIRNVGGNQLKTIDVDKNGEAAQENFVTSIPTVIFEKDGLAKQRFTGAQPKSVYIDTINSLK